MHRQLRPRLAGLPCSLIALAIGGCGGSGDSTTTAAPPANVALTTTVIDGKIAGALVCVDKNGNGACDADETQGVTDANGNVTLQVPAADAGKYPLVASVGTNAIDADHGAVNVAYTLSTPADQTAVLSPLTTLVQQTVQSTGASSADAAASIQAATGVSASLFADYTQAAGSSDGSLSAATLARLVVLTMQQQSDAVAAAIGTQAADGSTISQTALDRTVAAQVLSLLPSIVAAAADPTLQSTSGAALESSLSAAASQLVASSSLNAGSAALAVAVANPAPQSTAPPAAGIQMVNLNFTDGTDYFVRLLTSSLVQNTPDASNHTHFVDRRLRSSTGQLAKWGSGSDPWRNADLHWNGSQWTACALNFESWSSVRDTQGNSQYNYCDGVETGGSTRIALDVSGQSMTTVYSQLRSAGNTNIAISDPTALASTTFPSASKILYQSNTAVSEAIAYYPAGASSPAGTSNVVTQYSAAVAAGGDATTQPAGTDCNAAETNSAGSNSTTLESMIAAKPGTPCAYGPGSFSYGGVTYTSGTSNEWWGNSTASLGKLGNAPVNSGPAPGFYTTNTLLRVAFAGGTSNGVTYYACQERFNNGSPRNCTVTGHGTYTITTLGDGRAMTFANLPAQAAGLSYNRVFVERGGAVYFGYQSKATTTASARFNDTASKALLAQLGIPTEDPSVPLALTAASYQGTWDARDANETSATIGTTVFFSASGSVSCQDRSTGAFATCSLTINDPVTGKFTLVGNVSGDTSTGSFDFLAGTASGTYHDPTSTPTDGGFIAFRR